jgi:hypothetical protein
VIGFSAATLLALNKGILTSTSISAIVIFIEIAHYICGTRAFVESQSPWIPERLKVRPWHPQQDSWNLGFLVLAHLVLGAVISRQAV